MNTRLVIDDEVLATLKKPNSAVRIHGKYYAVTDDTNFALGDVVLDRGDGCHGVIDMIIGERAAVRDGGVAELAVPLSRLIKLKLKE